MTSSTKITYHTRSISLPTRYNPLTLTVEEQLCRLRSSELATSSSSSISHNLAGLKDLYECVEDFLSTQHGECLDTVLDGSIMLLDVCGITMDVLSQMKQSVQDLQSSIRRRRGADLDLANEINEYLTSRKKVTKVIRKCLGGLKKMQNKNSDDIAMVSVLREVEATTLAVLESLLSFLSGPKQSSWSLVSKLMSNKRVACEGETNEVEKVDKALNALMGHKQNKLVGDVKSAQKLLEALEMNIQDIEEGLECVFRGLVKTRVSLLNILNQ